MELRTRSVLAGILCLKFLLIYSYYSTDFEVHRNWLAITSKLQVKDWYTENTSQWTLDYPPLFACFEYILSIPVSHFHPQSLQIAEKPVVFPFTVIYQRLSVILGDILMTLAGWKCLRSIQGTLKNGSRKHRLCMPIGIILLAANAGFILVDNIHFQYNSLVTALWLLSIGWAVDEQFVLSGLAYCALISFKHIYLYCAPAYAAFFLRNYIYGSHKDRLTFKTLFKALSPVRICKLSVPCFGFLAAVIYPFHRINRISNLVGRLFPFKRGLTHAYWAPNFWALYNTADLTFYKALKALKRLKPEQILPVKAQIGYTSGLVQEYDHLILPNITPFHTFVISFAISAIFCAVVALGAKRRESFLRLLTLCSFTSYMFGWHVHEKAILLVTLPLSLEAIYCHRTGGAFFLTSIVAHVSLFPLFLDQMETPLKYTVTIGYGLIAAVCLGKLHKPNCSFPYVSMGNSVYFLGFMALETYKMCIHHRFQATARLDFIPLMLTSLYCSIGLWWTYIWLVWDFIREQTGVHLLIWYRPRWERQQSELSRSLDTSDDRQQWTKLFDRPQRKQPRELPIFSYSKLAESDKLSVIGGVDVSFADDDPLNAVVTLSVLQYPSLKVIGVYSKVIELTLPYMAGYLAFREFDAIQQVYRECCQNVAIERKNGMAENHQPQLLFVDGNGQLHPRGFGLACHVGVLLDIPTIGVAKNLHFVHNLTKESVQLQQILKEHLQSSCGPILEHLSTPGDHEVQIGSVRILGTERGEGARCLMEAMLIRRKGHLAIENPNLRLNRIAGIDISHMWDELIALFP